MQARFHTEQATSPIHSTLCNTNSQPFYRQTGEKFPSLFWAVIIPLRQHVTHDSQLNFVAPSFSGENFGTPGVPAAL